MTTAIMTDTITTYRVTATHPRLDGDLVMDLIATTPGAAVSRARLSAFHLYRDACMLDAFYSVVALHVGTCREAGHDRGEC